MSEIKGFYFSLFYLYVRHSEWWGFGMLYFADSNSAFLGINRDNERGFIIDLFWKKIYL